MHEVSLEKGHRYAIKIQYSVTTDKAGIKLVWTPPSDGLLQEAVEAAKNSDAVILALGISPQLEGEEMPVKIEGFTGGDRTDIGCLRCRRISFTR